MTTSTHVCEVSSDEMDPTTRDAGIRPKVVCLQKYDLQARERLLSTDACLIKKRGVAHTELLQTETKFKTKQHWPGIGPARAVENGRFRARSTPAGCPGAGSLAAAAGASKKSGQNFVSVLPEPHVMHSNTTITPRSVWGLKTLHTSTNAQTCWLTSHTASQQQAPCCSHWRYECRQHVNRRYNNVTYVHRLFVRATAASVGVFLPQAKKSVQIRPIYRGNALSGSCRSMNAEVTRAHTPHIAYRAHSNTLQRLQVATGLSLVQIHAQDRG
jgi:hypothetical protein